jgi:hypothetical protein
MGWNENDLTNRTHGPPAEVAVSSYVDGSDGSQHVVFHGPLAANAPFGFAVDTAFTQNVAYRSADGHLQRLFWTTSGWTHTDLTAITGAPLASGGIPTGYAVDFEQTLHFDYTGSGGQSDPAGHYFATQRTQHVFCISNDQHVVELWWTA